MKKSFYSNLSFLLFVNLLVKPFWIFGIDRTVQNTVGAETFGMYFALFNFSILFQILLDFGINNFNNRAVAQDEDFIKKHLPDILSLKMLLSLVYACMTLLSGFLFGYAESQIHLLLLLTGNQILISLLLYLRSNISGMHLFKTDSILSVLDKLLMIGICSWLLWGMNSKQFIIEWFIYAQTASLLVTILVAAIIVALKHGMFSLRWDVKGMKEIALKTYPYALLGLLMSVYYRVDGVMLERMLPDGAHEAGIYAASFRLLDAANMLGFLFASILLPMFARMIAQKENVQSLVNNSFSLIMAGATTIVCGCVFFRNEIMLLLYPQSTQYWSDIFGLLMPSFLGVCTVYIYGTLLTANGSLKILNTIALGGMLLNIVLNVFLIPEHKALGATVATLITQTLVAVAHIIAAKRVFKRGTSF
ncbi:MAG: oligosaccharide flippase family protein [Chitinophagales bacterium]|nr:oligosaccharide flippase family protein [Chitinophagales bacterium]